MYRTPPRLSTWHDYSCAAPVNTMTPMLKALCSFDTNAAAVLMGKTEATHEVVLNGHDCLVHEAALNVYLYKTN